MTTVTDTIPRGRTRWSQMRRCQATSKIVRVREGSGSGHHEGGEEQEEEQEEQEEEEEEDTNEIT